MTFFTDNQRIKLIGLIKKCPFLYDKTHVVYNKKILREKAWREIAKQVDADEDVCRQSWRSMRDQYYRSIYHMKKFGDHNKKYKHFDLLTFLGEMPQPRGRKCHVNYELEKQEMQKELWMLDSTNDDYEDNEHEPEQEHKNEREHEHGHDDTNTDTSQENMKPNFSEVILSENSLPCINSSPDDNPNNRKRKLSDGNIETENYFQAQEVSIQKLRPQNNYYKFDKYDHFFLSISSTVRDYGLSLKRLAELQCSVIKCVTSELEKFSKDL